ncbi:peptidoglycan-binding protein, partial [Salmonella enterica]|uniref:peptidoglycan-binding domain-containing protein n=1 Tax=Salmonella enterica TaxID=28901 RepID=UPI003CF85BF5
EVIDNLLLPHPDPTTTAGTAGIRVYPQDLDAAADTLSLYLLARAGYDVGKIDGVLGQASRSAVKAMQMKYGLPADSWPTAELLARMRGGGR